MKIQNIIPSVNYHLWEPCNMRCKFCFATFQDVKRTVLPKGHLPKEKSLELIEMLAKAGFQKITFAGGEPTLCPWLSELIALAKNLGMTTMIVTNGTGLSEKFLAENQENLDWIALSIDSLSDNTNLQIGRAIVGKRVCSKLAYFELIEQIKQLGYRLKINTVACQSNWQENLSELIEFAKPERWKILQVLPIEGQNSGKVEPFLISGSQFESFVERHAHLGKTLEIVPESNEQIKDSYVMIDPAGRFFGNSGRQYEYSQPILNCGVELAYRSMNYSNNKFEERKGFYEW
ncbi:MAG: radical S-adenosyl methionine domain-containing protein 2 [Flammeovirgaceae bacterium]|jgi:radical S-adenosyl methionine domain-containing protein 2